MVYTTTNKAQAENFAKKVVARRGGLPIVNVYQIDEAAESRLKTKKVFGTCKNWIEKR